MADCAVPATDAWRVTIGLARDRPRLAAIVLLRAAVAAAGLYTGLSAPDVIGLALLAASTIVLAYAALLALYLGTVRVEVLPAEVHLVWALRRIPYRLAPGRLTRVQPDRRRSQFGAQLGGFGVEFGGSEQQPDLTVVRLSTQVPVIMVPTAEHRRLAIAPADQGRLIEALTEATRLRRIKNRLGRPLTGIERAHLDQ